MNTTVDKNPTVICMSDLTLLLTNYILASTLSRTTLFFSINSFTFQSYPQKDYWLPMSLDFSQALERNPQLLLSGNLSPQCSLWCCHCTLVDSSYHMYAQLQLLEIFFYIRLSNFRQVFLENLHSWMIFSSHLHIILLYTVYQQYPYSPYNYCSHWF